MTFVNLATVLNKKTLDCFGDFIYEFADMLGPGSFKSLSIAGHTVFPCNSKNVQVSFSLFALKIKSFFLERTGITVVPWRSTFFSNLFFLI